MHKKQTYQKRLKILLFTALIVLLLSILGSFVRAGEIENTFGPQEVFGPAMVRTVVQKMKQPAPQKPTWFDFSYTWKRQETDNMYESIQPVSLDAALHTTPRASGIRSILTNLDSSTARNGQVLTYINGTFVWADPVTLHSAANNTFQTQPGSGRIPSGNTSSRRVGGGSSSNTSSSTTTIISGGDLTQATANGLYVNVAGDTMNGALVISYDGLGLNILSTASGKVIHAASTLSSSGNLVVDGSVTVSGVTYTFPAGDGLGSGKVLKSDGAGRLSWADDNAVGTGLSQDSGDQRYVRKSGDTMTGQLIVNIANGTVNSIGLKIINTLSGAQIHAEKTLTTSGSLVFEGSASGASLYIATSINGAGLTDCDAATQKLSWDSTNGRFSCGTDADTNTQWSNTGSLQTAFDSRYVNQSGDTMTGALLVKANLSGSRLIISENANISGSLLVKNNITTRGTLSGSNLTVSRSASISGTLIVKTGITSKGSLSGSTIDGFGLGSCNGGSSKLLYNSTTDKFECGTITASASSFSTGNVLTIGDTRYLRTAGGTMTGALIVKANLSGSRLIISENANISGSLLVKNNITTRGTLSGKTLTVMNGTSYVLGSFGVGTTNPLKGMHVQQGGTSLLTSAYGNGLLFSTNNVSGARIFMENLAGATNQKSIAIVNENVNAIGTTYFGILTDDGSAWQTNYALAIQHTTGNIGIGTATPKTKFDVLGTLSGTNLTVSRSASISGTLIVKTGITSKGSISGATISGFNLGSCTGTYQKLLYNNSTQKFECGTIATSSSFGTGNVLTIGDARYLRTAGGTMTGILIVKQTISGSRLTISENANISGTLLVLNSITSKQTISGSNLYAARSITGTHLYAAQTFNGAGLADCDAAGTSKLLWDAITKRFSCGTDADTNTQWSNTGSLQAAFDSRYVNTSGDTVTGALLVKANLSGSRLIISDNANISGSLLVKNNITTRGTLSGSNLTVSRSASISGTLIVKTGITSKGSVSGSTILGFGLGSCNAGTSKLLYNNATNKFECGTITASSSSFSTGNVLTIGDARYLRTAGGTMTGILIVKQTISGSRLTISENANISGSLLIKGNVGIGSTAPKAKLDVVGSLSGTSLTVTSLKNCDTIDTDINGNFICGTDQSAGSGLDQNTADARYLRKSGGTLTGALVIDLTGGDPLTLGLNIRNTISGSRLIVSGNANISGALLVKNNLTTIGTISGSNLTVSRSASISGTLIVKTGITSKGSISGSTILGFGLGSCNGASEKLLYNNSSNKFECGTITGGSSSFGTGNVLTIGDARYLKRSGGTMTGQLVVDITNGNFNTVGLKVINTLSGAHLHGESTLSSSGTLAIEGDAVFDDGTLYVDSVNNKIGIGTKSPNNQIHVYTSSAFIAAESTSSTSGRSEIFGVNAGGGHFVLDAFGTSFGGTYLGASKNGMARLDLQPVTGVSGVAAIGTNNSTALLFGTNDTEVLRLTADGLVGVGTTTPKAQLDVLGTISGSRLSISNNANISGALLVRGVMSGTNLTLSNSASISGTLIVKTGITSKGSISGSTIIGFGLGSCNGASEKLLYNNSSNKFECGTITGGSSSFGTGNVLTIGDARYLRTAGGTMTGILIVKQTISGSRLTISENANISGSLLVKNNITTRGTLSGKVLTIGNGTVGQPSITFGADPDTGLYGYDANTIAIGAGGLEQVRISNGLATFTNAQLAAQFAGSAATPAIAIGAFDTGFYRTNSQLGLTVNGVQQARWIDNGYLVYGTTSGNIIHAEKNISSSGTLVVSTSITSKGSLSGATIAGFNLGSCNGASQKLLYNNSTNKFECGTISSAGTFGTGNVLTIGDARYLRTAGGTMTGQLIVDITGGNFNTVGLKVINTLSGAHLHAEKLLTSSGNLIVEGDAIMQRLGLGRSPSFALDISTSNTTIVRLDNTAGAGWIHFLEGSASRGYIGYTDSHEAYMFSNIAANSFGIRSENNLYLGAGGDNVVLSLLSADRVGINTVTPDTALDVVGTISGSRLSISNNASISGALLVRGVMSGTNLTLSNSASISGTLIVKTGITSKGSVSGSTILGFGLGSCNGASQKLLYNSTSNKFECGTITGGSSSFGTGNVLTIGDARYLRTAGGTMTGQLVVDITNGNLNTVGLKVINTLSGAHLHAEKILTTSGTLVTESGAYFNGTTMVIQAGSNRVGIGTANPSGTLSIASGQVTLPDGSESAPTVAFGNGLNIGMYRPSGFDELAFTVNSSEVLRLSSAQVKVAGGLSAAAPGLAFKDDTNTGLFNSASDEIAVSAGGTQISRFDIRGLKVLKTLSGNIIHAEKNISSSGTLVVSTSITSKGSISGSTILGFGLGSCNGASEKLLYNNSSNKFECGTITGGSSSFGTGNVLTIGDARYLRTAGGTMTGILIVKQTISGSRLTVSENANISGALLTIGNISTRGTLSGKFLTIQSSGTISGTLLTKGNLTTKATLSGSRLIVSGHTNISGSLLVVRNITTRGTLSGRNLTIGNSASISGTLIVKTGITSKGSISGSTFYGAGLGSCNGASQKLLYNNSTGKFECGTITGGGSSFGTGNVLTIGDARYVKKSGDTMTGALTINVTAGDLNTIGLNVLNTLSGANIHAEKRLTSSGSIIVSNAKPSLVGTYNTSGIAYGVATAGHYAYVADTTSGLQIIDISNSSAPTLIGTYDTAGSARDLAIAGHYAYVADYLSGLQIIDISNPTSPMLVGTYDTTGAVSDVAIVGSYAYVADGTSGLQIIDISNPTSPILIGTYNTDDTSVSVVVAGRYAYVADGTSGLLVIDVSNPASPSLVGTYNTSGTAYGVAVAGRYAYVADYASGIQVIDISNSSAPTLIGTYDTDGSARGLAIAGRYAYVADYLSGLQIIDIGGIDAPGATIGALETTALRVLSDGHVNGNFTVDRGLNVGDGLYVYGQSAMRAFSGSALTLSTQDKQGLPALNVVGLMSGTRLMLSSNANISGALLVKDSITSKGSVSGATLFGFGLGDCSASDKKLVYNNSTGKFSCASDQTGGSGTFGTGNVLTIGDARYLQTAGGTMTGILIVKQTISGSRLTISENANISGALLVKGNIGIGTSSPSNALHINGSSTTYAQIQTTESTAPVGIKLTRGSDTYFRVVDDGTALFEIWSYANMPLRFGTNGNEIARFNTSGDFGIGTTAPKAKLDVIGTISGSRLSISNNANISGALLVRGVMSGRNLTLSNSASISGTLIVKTGITSKGSLSGSTFYGAGLGSCNGASQKLLYNNSTGKFECGTITGGGSSFGTGNVLTIGDARYVKKSGDTMTGVLTVDITGGNFNTVGLKVINTLSGAHLHAERMITSSGGLVWEGVGSGGSLAVSGGNVTFASNGATVFNELSKDVDFRIESDADSEAFLVDAGNNRVFVRADGDYAFMPSLNASTVLVVGDVQGSHNYLSILAESEATAGIKFGDGADEDPGSIFYDNSSDILWLQAGTNRVMSLQNNAIVMNEDSDDVDFRIESNGLTHALFVDGGTDMIGIGKSTPKALLDVQGTISGSRLSISNNANISGALLVRGVMSGTNLTLSNAASISGTLIVKTGITSKGSVSGSTILGFGLGSCNGASEKLLYNNSTNKFECGTITGGSSSFGTGNVLTIGDARYVKKSGDTMTGTLILNPQSGLALNARGTVSGRVLQANIILTSSGILSVTQKQQRGSGALVVDQQTNSTGAYFNSRATSAPLLVLNTRSADSAAAPHILFGYNGTFDVSLWRSGTSTLKTNGSFHAAGTLSGTNLTISRSASISGTLIVKTGITSKGSVSGSTILGFGLGSCNGASQKLLYNNSTNKFECGTITGGSSSFGTGNVLTIGDARYVRKSGDTMTGTLILNPQSGLALNARGTVSGRVLQANIILTSSGILSVTQKQQRGSGALVVDQQTNSTGAYFNSRATSAPLLVLNTRLSNSAAAPHILFGYNGTFDVSLWRSGTSTLKTDGSFYAVGVLSGTNLTVSRSASISGTLIVKTGITSKGSVSGSTISGFNLGSCNGASQKLLYNYSTQKFECGTDQTGGASGTFGTGNVLTIGDTRYVRTAGGTMTGALLVKANLSGSRLIISEKANISGSLLVVSGITTRGSISGATITISSLKNCDTIDTDGNGNFVCGTDQAVGSGLDQNAGDARYIRKAGGTMTGNLVIRGALQTSYGLQLLSGALINEISGFNDSVNIPVANLATRGIVRLSNNGNLQNIGSIQAGQTLLTAGGSFAAKADYTTGASPNSVATGDFNGDGKADLAVSNYGGSSVSVFLNNGNGTFAAKVDYTTASGPSHIAIGDLNGDGKADFVASSTITASVSVFLNNGNGTFAAKADYTTGSSPYSVAIGDLNGDGKADLAVANRNSTSVSVLINNGNGTFATKVDYTTVLWPQSVAIGDLNGDGKADLVVGNNFSNSLSVFLNNGNGTFAAKVDYTTGSSPESVAIGDLNGDGKADLAVVNYGSTSVSVLLNNPKTILYAAAGTGGRVGIGTNTLTEKLTISGAILIDSDETSASANAFKIVTNYSSTNNTVFRVSSSGAVYADGRYNSAGADYAEWFRSSDKVSPGEVVCIDVTKKNTVKRCDRDADSNVMGIVSSNPSFVGNVITGADGIMPPGYSLIGLIGQVPAHVVIEGSGSIRAGDSLTAASIPGYARRANTGESTVGVALEGFEGVNGAKGTVNVLISRRNSSLTVDAVGQKVLDTISSMKIGDEVSRLVSSATQNLNLDATVSALVTSELSSLDLSSNIRTLIKEQLSGALVSFDDTDLRDHIDVLSVQTASFGSGLTLLGSTLDDLSVRVSAIESSLSGSVVRFGSGRTLHSAAATIDRTLTVNGALHLSGSLVLSQNATIGAMSFSGSEVQIGSLVSSGSLRVIGNITIDGLAMFLGDVHIRGELSVSGKQAGIATIPKSGTAVTVVFSGSFLHTPIITASSDDFAPWRIRHRSLSGFTIELKDPAESDITFSWLAISSPDPSVTKSEAIEKEPIPFPVNALGQPVSSDLVWNSCIQGHPLITASGDPVSCARYHSDFMWEQPDLGISFTYRPNNEPPILLIPEGYVITVIDAPLPEIASPAPEPEPELEVAKEETEQEPEESTEEDSSTEESSAETTEDPTDEADEEEETEETEETDTPDEGTTDTESSNTSPAALTPTPATTPATTSTPVAPPVTTPASTETPTPSVPPVTESADPAPAPTAN